MDLIFGPKGKKWHKEIRSLVFGARTTRDLPDAGDTAVQTVVSAAYAVLPGADSVFDLNGAPSVSMRIVMSDGTATDKVAVKIYGSVDGTNFVDIHELVTGSADPIINDYGAVDQVVEASLGLRQIAVYAKYTSGAGTTGTVRVYWQPKFDAVSVNAAGAIKKFIDSCANLALGYLNTRITNWPSDNIAPINFVDTTNLGTVGSTVTLYYPSSTGMSLAAIKKLSLTGNILAGADNAVKLQVQATNDEDLTASWKSVYFKEDTTGLEIKEVVAALAGTDFAIAGRKLDGYANYRIAVEITIAVAPAVASNTVIIKGNSVGGA